MLTFLSASFGQDKKMYELSEGKATFQSEAPLELITAISHEVKGLIDPVSRKFAFSIPINSFKGFNNPLQQEHFNENYMENSKYPAATFIGKIIEKVEFENEKEITIRAKGMLNIHGVKRERIIKSELKMEDGKIYAKSTFSVLLKEHNIMIPKIVYQKIAKEIFVSVDLVLK